MSTWGAGASETNLVENQATEAVASVALHDPVVTPIPLPAQVTVLLEELNNPSKIRPAKKLKLAKKKQLPKSLLTRTERHQMAILAAKPKSGDTLLIDLFNEEESSSSAEDLDLHRSFSRPQVAKLFDQDDDDESLDISEAVKLRLLLARTKALEAHLMAQAAKQHSDDIPLSESVKLRLFLARTKAVQAHQEKFS